MIRDQGQITTRQALLGVVLAVVLAAAVIAGLSQMLRPGEVLPALDAPGAQTEGPCPSFPAGPPGLPPLAAAGALIECPYSFDGMTVRYRGEVVRAVLLRGDRAWVHLNDDRYGTDLGPLPEHRTAVGGNSGIPVSISAALARTILHVGNARHQGDVIEVIGTFHRSDPHDGGAPTIRAASARIVREGRSISRSVQPLRLAAALIMLVAAGAVNWLARREARR